jgi:quaternary ammonium compound-resistance protein SugE
VAWGYLVTASALEIGWAVGLKYTEGFTRVIPTVLVILGIVASFALVARAAQELPIGTAYGVFVGLGAFGTGIVGIVLLGEPHGIMRMLSLAAIVLGVVGLKVFGEPLENEQSKAGK